MQKWVCPFLWAPLEVLLEEHTPTVGADHASRACGSLVVAMTVTIFVVAALLPIPPGAE